MDGRQYLHGFLVLISNAPSCFDSTFEYLEYVVITFQYSVESQLLVFVISSFHWLEF